MAMFDEEGGSGWPEFAGVLLFALGIFRFISAISYFADSRKINDLTQGLFGSQTWAWGLWDLGVSALAIFAALSLFGGGRFGRIVAYLWAASVLVQSFTTISIAPWYSALTIALAVMVVYGLASSPRVQSA
jgi:hypothetical protein